jgi:oligopeptide/dipeptide ABC transporter ATP-binding protein
MAIPLIEIEDLRIQIRTRHASMIAIDGVNLSIGPGEAVGLVGESGCGKSLTALSILRLVPPPAVTIVGGRISFQGRDLLRLTPAAIQEIRGSDIAMIFQDPMTFMNPVFTVERQIGEALRRHTGLGTAERARKVRELLAKVQIPDPDRVARSYPHELSGGMRQRVLIATALSCGPKLIVADEPTTALDVTIQAQILDLLRGLVEETGISLLMITHDMGVVAGLCDRVYVMYAGKIVESADVRTLFAAPRHPYTAGLLRSVLRHDEHRGELVALEGNVPDLVDPPPGCRFCDRCTQALEKCACQPPPWVTFGSGAGAACWLYRDGGSPQ